MKKQVILEKEIKLGPLVWHNNVELILAEGYINCLNNIIVARTINQIDFLTVHANYEDQASCKEVIMVQGLAKY